MTPIEVLVAQCLGIKDLIFEFASDQFSFTPIGCSSQQVTGV